MPDERDDDQTRAMSPADEPTRIMPAGDEPHPPAGTDDPTRVMRGDDAVTRRVDTPAAGDVMATRRMTRRQTFDAPATERIALPPRNPTGRWLVALVIAVALVAGAVVGYVQHRPSDADVLVRALVGPDGGIVSFDGAGRITVPRGALPTPTAITVRKETISQRVQLGPEGEPGSVTYQPGELVVYAFEPTDLRFQQPVEVDLPRRGNGSAVFVDARGAPHVIAGEPSGATVKIRTTTFAFDSTSATGAG